MPTFTHKNGRYFVSHITGPSHVLLGLSFGVGGTQPVLVRLPDVGKSDHEPLDESRILAAVIAGVADAGVQLHPVEIIYCTGDSPHYELYQHCACLLAQRVDAGGEFIDS